MKDFPLYLIPLLPLLGAAFNILIGRKLSRRMVHLVACSSVFGSLVIGLIASGYYLYPMWVEYMAHHAEGGTLAAPALTVNAFDWIKSGGLDIKLGLLMDPLSAVMVFTITFVGLLIHIYSMGYMSHDKDYARFFSYMNIFTGSMLLLVLGDSLVVLFVGWEGVGLCSYLLIGFWYDKDGTADPGDANATAGRKAFIVNRIGDFAFLLGMFLLFATVGSLNINDLAASADKLLLTWNVTGLGWFGPISVATIASLLLLIGATGKSAQIPLYIWLPDAMAGPTPVSALIHAATMVTAGVYMVARLNFLFMLSPFAMGMVALVGALTALFAATIGLAQNDIKKVLAYSTISQLGYMFIAVGVGAFAAGVFHLFTHAFFKACLFLGAGAVIHAMSGKQDIREMGGLARKMPLTHMTFLVSCLAISGIPLFSGFFSKDEILWKAISTANPTWPAWFPMLIYVLGMAAAICTAFYMFRLYFLVFSGKNRADAETQHHIHEVPVSMTMPLVVLASGAALLGFLGLPGVLGAHANTFHLWLVPVVERGHHIAAELGTSAKVHAGPLAHNHGAEWGLMALSVCVAIIGILVARRFYYGGASTQIKDLVAKMPKLHQAVFNKYWVDEFYHLTVVRPVKWTAHNLWKVADAFFIDMLCVTGGAFVVDTTGRLARFLQNGNIQRYMVAMVTGIVVIILWAAWPPDSFEIRPGNQVTVGQSVTFAAADNKNDRRMLKYRWDFDGDGAWDTKWSPSAVVTHTYDKKDIYKVRLEVNDQRWRTTSSEAKKLEVK